MAKRMQVIGLKGEPGSDGVGISSIEQTTTSTESGGENILTITLTNGEKQTVSIRNGSGGSGSGEAGEDGVGIKSITQTTTSTADDGNNIITVTLTDGTTSTFTIQNGSKGSTGATGATGPQGEQGVSGVYVGSGDMPNGYNVQIDPDGEESDVVTREEFDQLEATINDLRSEIGLEITEVASLVGGDA